jgi:hypothetical protein
MCRHIFQTCHTLVTCSQCNVRLISWGFSPGVKKLFDKARKDGVLLEDFALDTAEKHFESTQHQNSNVPAKENFVVQGPPEAFGLRPVAPRPDPLNDPSGVRFRCPDCANVISTWTQMTRHLDATKHSLAHCAECNLTLKCYGPAQPQRHEKMTGHRGIVGVFRQKMDYALHPAPGGQAGLYTSCGRWQTPQYRCFCMVSFLHPLYLAEHLVNAHGAAAFPHPTCLECGTEGSVQDMIAHMHNNETHAEFDIPELHADDYLVTACVGCFAHDNSVTPSTTVVVGQHDSAPNQSTEGGMVSLVSTAHRILYQCPDCLVIFTSWFRLEEHLVQTKHGLCFCITCNRYLKPRGGSDSHTAITGHANIVREHLSRRDYEVLVNLDDPAIAPTIEPVMADTEPPAASTQIVFQCPMPSCLAVFSTQSRLEDHFASSRHGTVSCPECFEDVTVLDSGGITGHPHHIEVPEYLSRITCADDLLALTTDEQLVTHFEQEFGMCSECRRAVPHSNMDRHVKSAQCTAAAAPLDAAVWVMEPNSQPNSAPGSFHVTTSQPPSMGAAPQHRGDALLATPQPPMANSDTKLPSIGNSGAVLAWQWATSPGAAIGTPATTTTDQQLPTSIMAAPQHFVWAPTI